MDNNFLYAETCSLSLTVSETVFKITFIKIVFVYTIVTMEHYDLLISVLIELKFSYCYKVLQNITVVECNVFEHG